MTVPLTTVRPGGPRNRSAGWPTRLRQPVGNRLADPSDRTAAGRPPPAPSRRMPEQFAGEVAQQRRGHGGQAQADVGMRAA